MTPYLGPTQLGFGSRSGCEAIVHAIRRWLQKHDNDGKWCLSTMDFENACILNRIEIRLVTVFKYRTVELNRLRHLHCIQMNISYLLPSPSPSVQTTGGKPGTTPTPTHGQPSAIPNRNRVTSNLSRNFGRRRRVCSRFSTRSEDCYVDYLRCMSSQFSQLVFLHTCSGLRFLACICVGSVLADASKFVFDFVEILTEVGNLGTF